MHYRLNDGPQKFGKLQSGPCRRLLVWFFCFSFSVSVGLGVATVAEAAPPAGFIKTTLDTGFSFPTGLGIAPDGRIFILEQGGTISIYKNGATLGNPFAELPAFADGDHGLLGITFDPDFASNHYVYFYYTDDDTFNHVVRFNAENDIASGGPEEIYSTTETTNISHTGGTLAFGPDGKLYISIGDNTFPPNSQNLANPFGKVLRINKDGSIPSDNPFFGQAGKDWAIWAYGLRNPFRFQFDSTTGKIYLGDVGQDAWEEVNIIEKGKNYGWPSVEGACSGCGFENPIHVYSHNSESRSITGGPVYRSTLFPSAYRGRYFFGDYAQRFIKYLTFNADGSVASETMFDNDAGSVVDMKVGPDGAMYYVTIFPGELRKLSYASGNQTPTAVASADATDGPTPLTVNFSSAGSSDPEGSTLTYAWTFGDGTTSSSANPTKVYNTNGKYSVSLTVSDGTNQATAPLIEIQAGILPTVSVTTTKDGVPYIGGDSVSYQVTAKDSDGNDIPAADVEVEVIFHHDTHIHPFVQPAVGKSGSFTIPDQGETATDVYYEVVARATDSDGITGEDTANLTPKVIQFSVVTANPTGLDIELDGQRFVAPKSVTSVAGIKRVLNAPDQTNGSTAYTLSTWSDGGARLHSVAPTTSGVTYTATFAQAPPFVANYYPNRTLSGTPVLTRNDQTIDFYWGGGSPGAGLPIDSFSARWVKNQSFAAGNYEFKVTADDGIRLYIDGVLLIDKWIDQGSTTYTATKAMTAGAHEVKVEYYENGGGAVAAFSYDLASGTPPPLPPPPTPTFPDWKGEYFGNQSLTGTPALTRNDVAINFNWGSGSPAAGIPVDNFSTRHTKALTFEAAEYLFTVKADDGIRLYIDGVLLIDKWIDQGSTTYTATKAMTAGNHEVKVEYYENGGGADLSFSFVKSTPTPPPPPPAPTTDFVGNYYPNLTLSGTPVLTRNDVAINFDWGAGSPGAGVAVDNFSVRWVKNVTFEAASYDFTMTGDDGVRLYIDGVLLIDKWIDQGSTTYTATKAMTAGNHEVKMEYYERGGGAVAKLSWLKGSVTPPPPPPAPTGGWNAQYWNVPGTLSQPAFPAGAATLTRTDAAIDFNWGNGSPAPTINSDHFVARWSQSMTLAAGNYLLTTTADDGVRVLVDGVKVIDKWIDQGSTTYTHTMALSAGTHPIIVEYYENGGGAVAQFSLQPASAAPSDSFTAQYFSNRTLSGSPVLTQTIPAVNFNWGNGSPDPVVPNDNFSARYTKTKNYAAGNYTFTVTGDDGVRLYLDSSLLIDKWIDQGSTTYSVTTPITAGSHVVKLEYYENGGGAVVRLVE